MTKTPFSSRLNICKPEDTNRRVLNAYLESRSQQEARHGVDSEIEALLDIVNSSDGLDIHRSEEERSELDWEETEWPTLPSPPSSLPVGESDPFEPTEPMEDGQTIAFDDVVLPGVLAKSHARYSRPPSSLQLCNSDEDSSALQPDLGYSSGDSVFVHEEAGSYEGHISRLTHDSPDFGFTEDDDEPATSTASQGPRREDGLLDFIDQEAACTTFSQIKDDEFDATARFNSGLSGLRNELNDASGFPFERERRLAGHEEPPASTLVNHDTSSSDEVLGATSGNARNRLLNGPQKSGRWPATFPSQPSMSLPPSAGYFEHSQGERVGLDLTCDDEDELDAFEWELTATRGGPSPTSMGTAGSTDLDGALDDNVARRGQHCKLDFNQRPNIFGHSPDRPEEVGWDAIEEEEEFRISDVDMEIGAGDESAPLGWSREEDELELDLAC